MDESKGLRIVLLLVGLVVVVCLGGFGGVVSIGQDDAKSGHIRGLR